MEKTSPVNSNIDSPNDSFVKVRRGRVESVDLYEIKDSELDILEQGTPATLQLNFAIFLFSTAFTSIGALATATFISDITKNTFLFISVIGILGGIYLLFAWLKNKKSAKIVIKRIRERIAVSAEKNYSSNQSGEGNTKDVQGNLPK